MSRRSTGLSMLIGFAGGVLTGMFVSSGGSRLVGRKIAHGAHEGSEWLNDHVIQAKQRIVEAGDEAAEKFRDAAREAVRHILPDLAEDPEAWDDVFVQTARDLKNMRK